MELLQVRLAAPEDAADILAVYAPYITDTAITFETEPPSPADFAKRVAAVTAEYPYLVVERAGRIVAYAYAHRAQQRAAYGWNAELSVYARADCARRGLGRALYGALLELLRLQHVRNVYGVVALPNPGSEGLHRHFGFTLLGVHPHAGYKLGAWHDVGWFGLDLGCAQPPAPFLPIDQVDPAAVAQILRACGERAARGLAAR